MLDLAAKVRHSRFSVRGKSPKLLIFVLVASLALLSIQALFHFMPDNRHEPDFPGHMCEAIGGHRLPAWARRRELRESLPSFLRVYKRRPVKDNRGGMLIDHSFALYFIMRAVQPKVVIESGSFKGHSTWLIKQTLRKNARVISLDPNFPLKRLPGVEYLVGKDFRDFAQINWQELGVDPASAVVLFDDHQSGFRRLNEAMAKGFRRMMFEDSYDFLRGDNLSLKWVCERTLRDKWPGKVPDNFGRTLTPQTWETHVEQGEFLRDNLQVYYEFPPILSSALSGQTRFDPARSSDPLIESYFDFLRYFSKVPLSLFSEYTHFTYVETK